MGFFARWRQSRLQNELERSTTALERLEALERSDRQHTAKLDKLELDRPGFITALEELAERCHDILDQSEAKRARVDASENRRKRREKEQQQEPELQLTDREAVKANVRRLLIAQGKLQ